MSGSHPTPKLTPFRKRRFEAIRALGGVCVSCGEDDLFVLQIDHVFGDGHLERADRPGVAGRVTDKVVRRVLRGNTRGLQVLCANCHAKKTAFEASHDRHRRIVVYDPPPLLAIFNERLG